MRGDSTLLNTTRLHATQKVWLLMGLETSEATTGSHEHSGGPGALKASPSDGGMDGACLGPPLELQYILWLVSLPACLGCRSSPWGCQMPTGPATEPPPSPSKRLSFKPKHFRVRSSERTGAKLSWGQRPSHNRGRSPGQNLHLLLNTLLPDLEGSHGPQQRTHQPLAGAVLY